MVTTQLIVDTVSTIDAESLATVLDVIQPVGDPNQAPNQNYLSPALTLDQVAVPSNAVETVELPKKEPSNVPTEVPSPTQADAPVDVGDDDVLVSALKQKTLLGKNPTMKQRIATWRMLPSRYAMVTKLSAGAHKNEDWNKKIWQAEIEEIIMYFSTLCALQLMLPEKLKVLQHLPATCL